MNDDTRRRLEQAGGRPVPEPDPAFADRLEARLLAVAATSPVPAEPPPGPSARQGDDGRLRSPSRP